MKHVVIVVNFFVIFIISFSLSINSFASEKVTLSTIEYPPLFQSKVIPGKGYGIASDLTIEAFKAVDIDAKFDFIPMVRCVESVTLKKYPANLGSINWFTKDKKENLAVVVDLFYINFMLFHKKKRFPEGITYENLSELKKYNIGNVRGSSTTPVVEKAALNIEWVSKLELNFKKLYADRLDFAISGGISGWALIRELHPDSVNDFTTVKKPILKVPIGLVFHKDQGNLIKKFKKGIDTILENGKYYEILERYYGKDQVSDEIFTSNIKDKIVIK